MVIGITGGIGSGKTTLSNLLRSHGFPVYDTDKEARRLQNENVRLIDQTKALFGEDIYKNGELNRIAVASIVFRQPELLMQLSSLVHPVVKNDFIQWAKSFNQEKLLFMESAVLFEGNFDTMTDKIILVTASDEIRIERVMKRDRLSREEVIARMKNQIPELLKAQKSDLVINTDQGLPENVLKSIIVWQH
ncbi:MAG: dephospho-CoA kinase [Paludibacter sp.]|nr:dephospho-CoA kinase [Paludibacter sp.]